MSPGHSSRAALLISQCRSRPTKGKLLHKLDSQNNNMQTVAVYDVAVVGAGVVGSSSAYYLAKNNNKTLLLEQFMIPHTRGSSHGQSRVIRKAYVEEHYAKMMSEAYGAWENLEKETGTKVKVPSPLLTVGCHGSKDMENMEKALSSIKSSFQVLSSGQLSKQYPGFNFGADYYGIVDPTAGILLADKCVNALQTMFKQYGGTLCDGEQVTKIIPGDIVTIQTNSGKTYQARSLVVAAGPWTSRLVTPLGLNLPLKPVRVTVNYWDQNAPPENKDAKLPAFMAKPDDPMTHPVYCYGLPELEYPGLVKICLHTGPEIDPDRRDSVEEDWDIQKIRHFIKKFCRYVTDKPRITEKCIYTMTPDEDFILDTHPRWKNIAIGAGFSGTGFKLGPVTGRILADLAQGKRPHHDLSPFRMNRFHIKARI